MAYIDNPARSRPGLPRDGNGPAGRRAPNGSARTGPPRARARSAAVGAPYDDSTDWARIGTFVGGLALGALVGAGAAFLLAPRSGAETREWIADGARGIGGRAHHAWDDLRGELAWATRRGRRRLRRAATRGRWKAEDLWDRETRPGH